MELISAWHACWTRGLGMREQSGRHAFYHLADERVAALLPRGDDLLSDVARGVYVCPCHQDEAG